MLSLRVVPTVLFGFTILACSQSQESVRPPISEDLSAIAELKALLSVDLRYCKRVNDLAPLSGLRNLRSLALDGCDEIGDLVHLAELKDLAILRLR